AAIIASQAVISGAFSLTRAAIQMGYCPRLTILHTSERAIGQIYVPFINWMLLIAIIALVVGFRNSDNLAGAYGIAVTMAMLIDSILIFVVMRRLWDWPVWVAVLIAMPLDLFIQSIEASPPQRVSGTAIFLTSTPNRVPHALLHNLKHNKVLHER